MTVMDDLLERGAVPEGYKVEIFDGEVIMTPQSPEQDWTVDEVAFGCPEGRHLSGACLQ